MDKKGKGEIFSSPVHEMVQRLTRSWYPPPPLRSVRTELKKWKIPLNNHLLQNATNLFCSFIAFPTNQLSEVTLFNFVILKKQMVRICSEIDFQLFFGRVKIMESLIKFVIAARPKLWSTISIFRVANNIRQIPFSFLLFLPACLIRSSICIRYPRKSSPVVSTRAQRVLPRKRHVIHG